LIGAVRAVASPQIGFLRADAQRLPCATRRSDAVVSIAVLQLVPERVAALAEMALVLRPGGRVGRDGDPPPVVLPGFGGCCQTTEVYLFGEDQLGDILEEYGVVDVRTKSVGTIQCARETRVTPAGPHARGDHGGDAVREPDRHPNPSPGADGDGFTRRRTGLCDDATAPLPR
jgi:SAM-dependent methyltransferase